MKTTIPTRINSVIEAQNFLLELIKNKEIYHPEDSAHSIVWNDGMPKEDIPTFDECNALDNAMEQVYSFADDDFDPCGFILDNDDSHRLGRPKGV